MPKILLVEDNEMNRDMLSRRLIKRKYDVSMAVDGAEGLEAFDGSIEFVITDWNMPNMGGLDFVKALRSRDPGKDVPILMVTTRSVREDIVSAAQAGVNNYVVKPFTPQVLKEKIDQVFEALATS